MSEIQSPQDLTTDPISIPPNASPDTDPAGDVLDAPAVVAVIVALNPGEHFAETLQSLGDQDYENLSVLVVDAGSDEPIADRVAEVLPQAYLHRLAGDPGWSVAANQSIELVSGSPFLLFCHDDVALAPDCVSQLMGELYRSNGGIAGPKLVRWSDDRRLLQLGMGSDRFGVMVDQVEPGEFDQDQYDSVRDVFVIPGGVQLIRTDLFTALGGFDPTIKTMGEDLDLCWRAHAAGARALIVPAAKARHRESMAERVSARERRRLLTRHRLRTLLAASGRRSYFTVVPLAFLLILIESAYSLLAGRRGQSRDVLAAIPWNLTRLDDLRRKRRHLKRIRTVSDAELRQLQIGGSARLAAFSRGQFSAGQDRFSGMVGSVRSSFRGEDAGNIRDATVLGTLITILLVFGSRHMLTRGVAPVGQIPDVPTWATMVREWLSGWRTVGTGGAGSAPTALPLLAIGRLAFFWAPGLFETLLVVAPVFLGPVGVYRLARPLTSARAGAVGALVYACNPIVVAALSAARWEALVIWAAMPFLFGALFRVGGFSPYGSIGGPRGPSVADRTLPVRLIRFAFLVAFVTSFAPAVLPVIVVVALTLIITSVFTGEGGRPKELGAAAAVAVIGTVALHGPWGFDSLQGLSWRWLVGPRSPEASYDSMLELLQFAPGAPPARFIALGLVVAAALALVVAKRELFYLAAQGWLVAVVFLALAWAARRDWLPMSLPTAEILLAPVAAGLALAVIVGVRTLEEMLRVDDIQPRALRVQRGIATVGALSLTALFFSGLLSALSGTWELPTQSFSESTAFLVNRQLEQEEQATPGRILWIGDAGVLPLDASVSGSGINYAVSDGGRTEARGRWSAGSHGSTDGVGRQLDLARSGEVVRLGRLLAPYGIDHVVLIKQLAPAPYAGPEIDPGMGVEESLFQQLDLEGVPGVPNLLVFRNTSSSGIAPVLSPGQELPTDSDPVAQLDIDLANSAAPAVNYRPGKWQIIVPDDAGVFVAVPHDDLRATGARTEIEAGFDDLTVILPGPGGEVRLEYDPFPWRELALFGQFLLVMVGAILAQTRREGAR